MGLRDLDIEAFLNMRDWFQDAITTKGGKIIDTGMGGGRADLGVEIDGYEYGVQIIPRMEKCRPKKASPAQNHSLSFMED